MTKVAIIGDSHVHALKSGWDRAAADFPEVAVTFFGAPKTEHANFVVLDGELRPGTDLLREHMVRSSRGLSAIKGDFDHYLVLCTGLRIGSVLWPDKTKPRNDTVSVEQVTTYFRNVAGASLLGKLRQCTQAPVVFLACPHQPETYAVEFAGVSEPIISQVVDAFSDVCRVIASDVSATFLPQPAETISANRVYTRPEYASRKLRADGQPDRWHTNATYGEIVARMAMTKSQSILIQSRASAIQ